MLAQCQFFRQWPGEALARANSAWSLAWSKVAYQAMTGAVSIRGRTSGMHSEKRGQAARSAGVMPWIFWDSGFIGPWGLKRWL